MAGGTLCSTEKGFTVRVPELRSSTTLAVTRCEKRGKAVLCLDNAFSLIEGHPTDRLIAVTWGLEERHPPIRAYVSGSVTEKDVERIQINPSCLLSGRSLKRRTETTSPLRAFHTCTSHENKIPHASHP